MSISGGEHRCTDRVQRCHRAADDHLHQIDIVNHQVEHHVHVGAALLERRQAMALDEARPRQQRLGRQDRRIEALQMTDLQHPALLPRGCDQPLGLRGGLGDRLLDQHVRAVLQKAARDVAMRRRRRHDADGVHLAEQLPIIAVGRVPSFGRDPRGGLRLGCPPRRPARNRASGAYFWAWKRPR